MTIYYGFYSEKAAQQYGTNFWQTADEGEVVVEITGVLGDKDGSSYAWDDKMFVAEVTKYVKRGKIGEDDCCTRWDY
jgi:hypothetical protein